MRFLFIDNFRGFSRATIPLLDVNFLVGENSTGKTSVLTMLRMLTRPQSFMGMGSVLSSEDHGEDVQFGHFDEMVSVHSSDRTYFHLGLVDERPGQKKGNSVCSGLLLTYRAVDGLPKITQLTCTVGGRDTGLREVSIKLQDGKMYTRSESLSGVITASSLTDRMQIWLDWHSKDLSPDWLHLDLHSNLKVEQVPLFYLLSLAAFRGLDGDGKSLPFPVPQIGPPLVWIAPIRARPRRTYDEPGVVYTPDGTHTPYVIRRMLNSDEEARKFKDFIQKIGKVSGLFEKIEIRHFGEREQSPFEVDAYVDGKALNLGWLGYGVSQSLPIFVEILDRPKGSVFAIQQPEVHLHPRAQASLGDAFFEMARRDQKSFVVETHSDFAIDRFRVNYRRKMSAKERTNLPASQILFFERRNANNIVTPILINNNGELSSDQPDSYRSFFIKEQINLLGI